MYTYRKKPVNVQAWEFTPENIKKGIPDFIDEEKVVIGYLKSDLKLKNPIAQIYTLDGLMSADVGDWIIQGVNGEYYPCKPDIFAETYDKVND